MNYIKGTKGTKGTLNDICRNDPFFHAQLSGPPVQQKAHQFSKVPLSPWSPLGNSQCCRGEYRGHPYATRASRAPRLLFAISCNFMILPDNMDTLILPRRQWYKSLRQSTICVGNPYAFQDSRGYAALAAIYRHFVFFRDFGFVWEIPT